MTRKTRPAALKEFETFPEGAIQVAVSEAPGQDRATADCSAVGASDTALRHIGTNLNQTAGPSRSRSDGYCAIPLPNDP